MSRAKLECERYQRTETSATSIVLVCALNVRYPLGNSEFKTWPPGESHTDPQDGSDEKANVH